MMWDDQSCNTCRYEDREILDEPCISCKHTLTPSDPEYNKAPLLWRAKDDWDDVSDMVNHPNHYNQGEIECIDAMLAAYGKDAVNIFCLLNAFKYLWRAEHKNGNEDLDKAIWYLKKRLELCSDE